MTGNLAALMQEISVLALPAIFAITLHEAAHGFVAHRSATTPRGGWGASPSIR